MKDNSYQGCREQRENGQEAAEKVSKDTDTMLRSLDCFLNAVERLKDFKQKSAII